MKNKQSRFLNIINRELIKEGLGILPTAHNIKDVQNKRGFLGGLVDGIKRYDAYTKKQLEALRKGDIFGAIGAYNDYKSESLDAKQAAAHYKQLVAENACNAVRVGNIIHINFNDEIIDQLESYFGDPKFKSYAEQQNGLDYMVTKITSTDYNNPDAGNANQKWGQIWAQLQIGNSVNNQSESQDAEQSNDLNNEEKNKSESEESVANPLNSLLRYMYITYHEADPVSNCKVRFIDSNKQQVGSPISKSLRKYGNQQFSLSSSVRNNAMLIYNKLMSTANNMVKQLPGISNFLYTFLIGVTTSDIDKGLQKLYENIARGFKTYLDKKSINNDKKERYKVLSSIIAGNSLTIVPEYVTQHKIDIEKYPQIKVYKDYEFELVNEFDEYIKTFQSII